MKTIIASAVCSSILLLSGCSNSDESNSTAQNSIATPQKSTLASGIEQTNIDKSVRPQDNFYRYINGGWMKKNKIPDDKTAIGSFYDLRDKADDDVKAIIEELAANEHLTMGSDEQKVADLFRSYMDTDTRNAVGTTPIKDIFNAINNLKNKDELATFFGEYSSIGINNPLALYVNIDEKDSSSYAAYIWQNGLNLPDRDYYFNTDERFVTLRANYLTHIEKMLTLAGLPNAKESAKNIMVLETKLADSHWTRVETRDSEKSYNKIAINELNTLTNKFNWQAFLAAEGVTKQQDIIINQPSFIKGFGKVFDETSLATWQQYLTFNTLNAFSNYLTTEIDKEDFDFFSKQLNGLKEQRPQWKRGVRVVNSNLGEVIGKVYVARHFTPAAKARMSELVENLRNAYGSSIDNLEWMSKDTKKAAQVKLAAFTPKIGYPDQWEDYSKLSISADDLVGNIIRARKAASENELSKLGGPIRKWEWHMTPQTVNAYYNPPANEIVFPAAILQPPFFNMEADDAVNYGGIGAVIGHEMGHGFDDQGRKSDGDGIQRDWWTAEDATAYEGRAKALAEQYSAFEPLPGENLDGNLGLGENIGDLTGVTMAYDAYRRSLNGKEAPVIDGYTGDQRFFMAWAQVWAIKWREAALSAQIKNGPHSPGEFRANGIVRNFGPWYDAFGITPEDAMYIPPEERVKIW